MFIFFMVFSLMSAISALSFTIAYRKVYRILHTTLQTKNTKVVPVLDKGSVVRQFSVQTKENLTLAGYVLEQNRPAKGIIVACHNYGGSKEGIWRYAKFLYDAGYIVVAFDFHSHGESDGKRQLCFNHQEDMQAIIDYVNIINKDHLPVGIFGLSAGSVNGLLYASRDKNIKAVVADGGPLLYRDDYIGHLASLMRIKNPWLKSLFTWFCLLITDLESIDGDIREALALLKDRPVFFIQGEKDFINPPRNTEKAMKLLGSVKAERWVVEDANHLTGFAMQKDEYKKRVAGFFDRTLGASAQEELYAGKPTEAYVEKRFGA